MANPRQRRKSRSSSHKPVSHSRNAKRNLKKTPPIRGPKALQDAWDKRKTVRQNYAALGLVHDLNPLASGGVEPFESMQEDAEMATPASIPQSASVDRSIPTGYGKIIRDEAGNVLRIELAVEEEKNMEGRREATIEELAPEVSENIMEKWVTGLGGGKKTTVVDQRQNIVESLRRISAVSHTSTTLSVAISGVGPRYASAGEVAYLERLLSKYGTDVERMARDRKFNSEQRTAGELRRALRRAGFNDEQS